MERGGAIQPSGLSSSPSFNSYSSNPLADLALEVEGGLDRHRQQDKEEEQEEDDGDDFEFVPVAGDVCDEGFVISADQIGPVFPVFNRNLLLENGYGICSHDTRSDGGGGGDVRSIRIPLMDLFMEEDLDPLSYFTSSEADGELEGIPEGSYCVWTPRESAQYSSSWCKKSNSTGSRSSRRWRFLDLLRRSNSDRKDSFVFFTLSSNGKLANERRNSSSSSSSSSESNGNNGKWMAGAVSAEQRKGKKAASASSSVSASALEVFYTRSKVAVKGGGGNRRKSYLPYRQDLVGFFANVNSLGRTFPPLGRI